MRLLAALLLLGLNACVSAYSGHARELDPDSLRSEPGWTAVRGVPLYRQAHERDCGPAALAMVVDYLRPDLDARRLLETQRDERVSVGELRDRARALGFAAFVLEGQPEDLVHELERGRPLIVGMAKPQLTGGAIAHYEVVVGIHKDSRRIATLDPATGTRQNSLFDFMTEWQATGRVMLVVLPQSSAPAAQAWRSERMRATPPVGGPRWALPNGRAGRVTRPSENSTVAEHAQRRLTP
jgi:predicted double-glycine peptidase